MAKANPAPESESKAAWSSEEVAVLFKDLEAKDAALGSLTKKMDEIYPTVERLKVEMELLAPNRSELPVEIVGSVRPDQVYLNVLQGLIIGTIQVMGVGVINNDKPQQWDMLCDKMLLKAETMFNRVCERYGVRNR